MALDPTIVELIRYEIGDDLDFVDDIADETATTLGSLERLYTNANAGQSNVLITAGIVWRKRLAAMQARSFDITKEGNWLARSQRTRYLRERVAHYERMTRDKPKGKNADLLSRSAAESSS
jgi:hypothetical protein